MIKRIIVLLFVVFAGLCFSIESNIRRATAQDEKVQDAPDVIVLAENVKLGKVTFNHSDHFTKNYSVDGTAPITCVECHHVEQPASEAEKTPPLKTVYPADRTVTLTAESLKDPATPTLTSCRSCHLAKGAEPTVMSEIPQIKNEKTGKTKVLNSRNAFHMNCAGCHDRAVKARPKVQAPRTMKCMSCHKRG